MVIILKTDYYTSTEVVTSVIPRKGEKIVLNEVAELYSDEHGQSPLWEVVDVIHEIRCSDSFKRNLVGCITVVVKNEEDE